MMMVVVGDGDGHDDGDTCQIGMGVTGQEMSLTETFTNGALVTPSLVSYYNLQTVIEHVSIIHGKHLNRYLKVFIHDVRVYFIRECDVEESNINWITLRGNHGN